MELLPSLALHLRHPTRLGAWSPQPNAYGTFPDLCELPYKIWNNPFTQGGQGQSPSFLYNEKRCILNETRSQGLCQLFFIDSVLDLCDRANVSVYDRCISGVLKATYQVRMRALEGPTQLSYLKWMPNSVSMSFGPDMKMGSSRRFKQHPKTYRWVSSRLPFTVA